MSATNDLKYAAINLTNLSLNDEYFTWLLNNGGTGNTIPDREHSMLIAQGATPGAVNDMWYQVLIARGYTGALPDMLFLFWLDGGAFELRMQNGSVAADSLTATVNFSDVVTFTELTIPNGMKIRNLTTPETAVISAAVGSGTSQVVYTISFATPMVFGDLMDIEYDGLGDYVDDEAAPMGAQTLPLTNTVAMPLEILTNIIIQEES